MNNELQKGEKYLPVGTVVILDGGKKRVMITGFCSIDQNDQEKIFDYSGCLYPEGFLKSDQVLLFDHEQIKTVYHMGLIDDEEKEFKNKLKEVLSTMTNGGENKVVAPTPAVPAAPAQPAAPTAPVIPAASAAPTAPVIPVIPSAPAAPVVPSAPEAPATPAPSTQPAPAVPVPPVPAAPSAPAPAIPEGSPSAKLDPAIAPSATPSTPVASNGGFNLPDLNN